MARARRGAGVWRLVREKDSAWARERLVVVLLDRAQRVIDAKAVPPARLTVASLRRTFRDVPLTEVTAVLGLHNQPRGNPLPSKTIDAAAQRLTEIAGEMGVSRVDHVVFHRGEYHTISTWRRP